jgi:starch phosphorylase
MECGFREYCLMAEKSLVTLSGTSGMKAALNGVSNLSLLDGWWIEGFNKGKGWAFDTEVGANREDKDSEDIYNILEKEVIPLYSPLASRGENAAVKP